MADIKTGFKEQAIKTMLQEKLLTSAPSFSQSFSMWFDPLEIHLRRDEEEPELLIIFPHTFFTSWFSSQGKKHLEQAAHQLLGDKIKLSYRVRGEAGTRTHGNDGTGSIDLVSSKKVLIDQGPMVIFETGFERSTTHPHLLASDPALLSGAESGIHFGFDTFLCGPKNSFVLDILKKNAQGQETYSPILLRGATGTGKTMLLKIMAVAYSHLRESGDVRIMTARDFMAWFNPGLSKQDELRTVLRSSSAFCLDDVQLLQDNPNAQTEITALIEFMHDMDRPVVLTASSDPDRGLNDPLSLMKPALFSRLCMGVVLELSEPDIDVKMRYAQDLLLKHSLGGQRDLALTLARHCVGFRQVQGIITRISAFSAYSGQLPDEHDLDIIFRSSGSPGRISSEAVLAMVATRYGYSTKDLRSKKRNPDLVEARQIAMYLCRELLGESYPALGRIFGNKDHSTVIHAVKKIKKKQVENKDMHNLVTELTQSCRQHLS